MSPIIDTFTYVARQVGYNQNYDGDGNVCEFVLYSTTGPDDEVLYDTSLLEELDDEITRSIGEYKRLSEDMVVINERDNQLVVDDNRAYR